MDNGRKFHSINSLHERHSLYIKLKEEKETQNIQQSRNSTHTYLAVSIQK